MICYYGFVFGSLGFDFLSFQQFILGFEKTEVSTWDKIFIERTSWRYVTHCFQVVKDSLIPEQKHSNQKILSSCLTAKSPPNSEQAVAASFLEGKILKYVFMFFLVILNILRAVVRLLLKKFNAWVLQA